MLAAGPAASASMAPAASRRRARQRVAPPSIPRKNCSPAPKFSSPGFFQRRLDKRYTIGYGPKQEVGTTGSNGGSIARPGTSISGLFFGESKRVDDRAGRQRGSEPVRGAPRGIAA